MFTTVWAFNHAVRYAWIFIRVLNVKNDILYYPILILNISFELHLVLTAVLFYKIFEYLIFINEVDS